MKIFTLVFFLLISFQVFGQQNPVSPTPAKERLKAKEKREALLAKSIVANIDVDNIGPTVFSGRVSDIDVNPNNPTEFLVAYASGGLWITKNNGTTFTPIFDNEDVLTIGDIAVDWETGVIWLGSGEVNSSRSSYAGVGMYVSPDMGKTWEHKGLEESHHIGRVIIHPNDPNIVFVAVLGHLYSPNQERGIYKTTDGGNSWQKTLFVDENTGGIDLVLDPQDPNTLYAAMWERERRSWNFVESGPGSGIHKSSDNGETWSLVTGNGSGFPSGEGVGRIGIDATIDGGETIVYVILDNYFRRPKKDDEEKDSDITKDELRGISNQDFVTLDVEKVEKFLRDNRFPEKYEGKEVIEMVKNEEIDPIALVEFLEDANSLLFDTPVIEAEIYRSSNNGTKWTKTHDDFLNGVHNSYGYYFAQIRTVHNDPNKIYVMGFPILRSEDGGKTFKTINGDNVHVDHHALWVNPNMKGHLINGNDGGLNISYDDGDNWIKCNSVPVGQFYYVNVDMVKPYNVYGGLQDNGVWKGPNNYKWSARWHGSGNYPYKSLMGGDGMQIQIDSRDQTVYTGFQFGNYFRINQNTGQRKFISPKHELGERPYRWNWQSPILLSKHNEDIVYFGANKLMRSLDKGNTFKEISEDLTHGGQKGDVPYGTISTLDESKFRFGLVYVGTDDGRIHRTDDGGFSWNEISAGLPTNLWVARIIASDHEENRVYAVLNGYRWDDFTPYLYVSDNYGETWRSIADDLPIEPLNVIKEDPENENLLYVGSDHGVYISSTGGKEFMRMGNLPVVPVHDLVVHPRESDLIIGTHGRSLYKVDVKPLQELVSSDKMELTVFSIQDQRYRSNWGNKSASYRDPAAPKVKIVTFSPSAGKAKMSISVQDTLVLLEKDIDLKQGIASIEYDLSFDKKEKDAFLEILNKDKKGNEKIDMKKTDNGIHYLKPGSYKITISKDGQKSETTVKIK